MNTRLLSILLALSCPLSLMGCGDSPTATASTGAGVTGQPACPASACALVRDGTMRSLFGPKLGLPQEGPAITGEVSLRSCSYTSAEIPITSVTVQVRCVASEAGEAGPAGGDQGEIEAVRASMRTMFGKEPIDAGDAARPALWTSRVVGKAGGTSGEYYVFGAGGVQIAVAAISGLTDEVARAYSKELAREALEAAGQGP